MTKKVFFILLTMIMVFTIIVGSIVSSALIKTQLTENLVSQFADQEKLVAKQVAKTLEVEIAAVQEKLILTSQVSDVKDGKTDECNEALQRAFTSMQSKVGNLGRVGIDGKFRCSLNKALIGVPAANLGAYIPEIFNDPEHHAVMSRAFVPPGISSYIVAVHIPIFNDKTGFDGTLGGAIYFDELQKKYLNDVNFTKQGYVVLIDDNGMILFHPQKELIGKTTDSPEVKEFIKENPDVLNKVVSAGKNGETGTVRYISGGSEKLASYTPVNIFSNRKWIVLVTVPISDVNEALVSVGVDKLFQQLLVIIIGVIVFVAAVFLVFMMISLFLPLEKIKNASEKLGEGNLDIKVDIHSKDEIGQLASSFNEMVEKLKDSYDNLEDKVKVRTQELETANEKLKELDRLKDEFVSLASHQLKTPLTAIRWNAELIGSGDLGKLSKKQISSISEIESVTQTMTELVNAFLNVSRIQESTFAIDPVPTDLVKVAEDVMKEMKALIKQKNHTVTTNFQKDLEPILVDPKLMRVIFQNLISNAIKYTPDKGKVDVSIAKKDDQMVITVQDNGYGIPKDEQAKIFTKLYRAHNVTKMSMDGTGLGLYIIKAILEHAGGDIRFESEENKGSTFIVSLPLSGMKAKQGTKQIS